MRDRYEVRDVHPHLIVALASGVGLFLLAAPLTLSLFYTFPRHDGLSAVPLPPKPRLQVAATQDLDKLRAAEDVELTTYGWIDRDKGEVRLPIARAMELTAQRGIAGWSEATPDPQIPPRAGVGR